MHCFTSWRFNHLKSALPHDWIIIDNDTITNVTVPQTMIWDSEKFQVWWEYHDGVVDDVPRESLNKLFLCYKNRNPNKHFIYVKPNLSLTRCVSHIEFAKQNNFDMITCPKWSYYLENRLHDVRREIREMIKTTEHENLIKFIGKKENYRYDKSISYERPFVYGIAGCDLPLFNMTQPMQVFGVYDRIKEISQATMTWKTKFIDVGMLTPESYVGELSEARYSFQPHGAGLRHAVYESMMLGKPSVVPEISYLDDDVRKCNIVYSPGKMPMFEEIEAISREKHLSEWCIDTYETKMTPEAIINNVITQLRELNVEI